MLKAAIDIGTNSTRLYVADVNGEIKRVEKHTTVTRLGKMVDSKRMLGEEGIERNVNVLLEYKKIAESYAISNIKAIATSAVRDASNRDEFINAVKGRTGIEVEVISGAREAELGYIGASLVIEKGHGVICDIGGGSTELICGLDGRILFSNSIDIGSVRMTERFMTPDSIEKEQIKNAHDYIKSVTHDTVERVKEVGEFTLAGIGGTVTTIAAIDQELAVYDIDKVHNYKLTRDRVNIIFDRLVRMNIEERIKIRGLQKERADVIPAGTLILKTIMEKLDSSYIIVSERDNLDGILMEDK